MKTAVIGYGYWGKNMARVVSQSNQFELAGICDKDSSALASARKPYPNVPLYRRVEDIPASVEAVAVVTPTDSHFSLVKRFLENRVHVLVAKPLARTLDQALALQKIAAKNRAALFVDHTFVFHPAVAQLKKLLPRIGKPYFVMAQRLNLGLYRPDVNVIYDLMPHDVSILVHLFGKPIVKAATTAYSAAGLPREDLAHTAFELAGGIKGFITASWLWPTKVRQFYVVGSKGMLVYDDTEVMAKVRLFDTGITVRPGRSSSDPAAYTSLISYRQGDMYSPAVPNTEALAIEMEAFAGAIRSQAERRRYDRLNLLVMESLEKILRSKGRA